MFDFPKQHTSSYRFLLWWKGKKGPKKREKFAGYFEKIPFLHLIFVIKILEKRVCWDPWFKLKEIVCEQTANDNYL